MVVVVEGVEGMRKKSWARWQNLARLWWNGRGGGVAVSQGPDVRARSRMSGAPDFQGTRAGCPGSGSGTNTMNSTVKIATPGQNSDELVDGNRGRDGEKLG